MAKIKEITTWLEQKAALSLQESYDNAGLLVGSPDADVKGVLVCLDSTEEVIREAEQKGCNLVIAHHPIIFSGIKKFSDNYIHRTIIRAIKNDIAIYAIHTNLDNVLNGVNSAIAEKLQLRDTTVLAPAKQLLRKLVTFVPADHLDAVRNNLFRAGAGAIGNYDECSFTLAGSGTFRGNEQATPFIGEKGTRTTINECRLEVIFESYKEGAVLKNLRDSHPYEEVAFDIYELQNYYQNAGSGLIGKLADAEEEMPFLLKLKKVMKTGCVKHTKLTGRPVSKVAVCGGSGSFLLNKAIEQGADIFISSDFKYHQFFDADSRLVIADIGHYESEQFTIELIYNLILEKFSTFAVRKTELNTNPVSYL